MKAGTVFFLGGRPLPLFGGEGGVGGGGVTQTDGVGSLEISWSGSMKFSTCGFFGGRPLPLFDGPGWSSKPEKTDDRGGVFLFLFLLGSGASTGAW